jgi:putative copper export protein
MFTFRALVLFLHLAAVVVWIGGMAWMTLALQSTKHEAPHENRLLADLYRRYRAISWEAVGLLILTGLFNLINAGYGIGFGFSPAFLSTLAIKMALFAVLLGLHAWHSLVLLPRLLSRRPEQPAPPLGPALYVSLLNLALAFTVIFLGLGLR